MKNKFDLNACGVQEMEVEEMRTVDGGIAPLVVAGVVVAVGGFLWGVANFVKDVIVKREQFDMTKW